MVIYLTASVLVSKVVVVHSDECLARVIVAGLLSVNSAFIVKLAGYGRMGRQLERCPIFFVYL